jgi:hypothetical protein
MNLDGRRGVFQQPANHRHRDHGAFGPRIPRVRDSD